MTKKNISEPVNEPVYLSIKSRINLLKKLFSEPKIYRPKELIEGKEQVSIKKLWHVYYYFRDPETGVMKKFTERQGINRLKTIKEREEFAKNLQKALNRFLQEGNSPFERRKRSVDVITESYTVLDALNLAFDQKKGRWKESTTDVNRTYLTGFIKWLQKNNLEKKPIAELSKKHISFYLSYILAEKSDSNTTRNNHRRFLSSMFTELVEKDIIEDNFIKKIPLLKSTPKKNKPFSQNQLVEILRYTRENDLYLYEWLKVMWYTFLRPIEVLRIEIKNINLEGNVIDIETKTKGRDYIRIVKPLQEYFDSLELNQYAPTMFLFGKNQGPGYWITVKEKSREDFFIRRFKKIKNHFNLSEDYGIYSFRHTGALSLY